MRLLPKTSHALFAPSEWIFATVFTVVNYLLASSVQPRYCICPDEYTAQSQKCVKVLRLAAYFELVLILQHVAESQKIRSASLLFLPAPQVTVTF